MAHPIGVRSSERASKVTGAALIASLLVLAGLRAFGSAPAAHHAGMVAIALLGVRVGTMVVHVVRGTLPWSWLLLPAILLIQGAALLSREGAALVRMRVGAVALLEIAFVMVAVRELRRTRGRASTRRLDDQIARAFEALVAPRLARLIAFELTMVGCALRFGFGGWRRAVPVGFAYHRTSGLRSFLPMLPLLVLGDLLLVELVILPHASPWLRAGVHAAGIYALVWLVGLYASMRARPHELAGGRLMLRRGLLRSVEVPAQAIESLRPVPVFGDDWKARAYYRDTIRVDVAGPAVLEMLLKVAVRANGVLGAGPLRSRVIVAVDEPVAFTAAIDSARAAGLGPGDVGAAA